MLWGRAVALHDLPAAVGDFRACRRKIATARACAVIVDSRGSGPEVFGPRKSLRNLATANNRAILARDERAVGGIGRNSLSDGPDGGGIAGDTNQHGRHSDANARKKRLHGPVSGSVHGDDVLGDRPERRRREEGERADDDDGGGEHGGEDTTLDAERAA